MWETLLIKLATGVTLVKSILPGDALIVRNIY